MQPADPFRDTDPIPDADPFREKVAIVTGGASGIGAAIGAALFARGAHVVLADVDGPGATATATRLHDRASAHAGSVTGRAVDVRDGDAVQALVTGVADAHGHLDLAFNNAGISIGGESHTMAAALWRRVVDVNFTGVVNCVTAAYPIMVEQGYGHIVNTASAAGLAPAVMTATYSASKHAVVGLSLALRPEAAQHGVRVSVLCPGAVDTPILDQAPPADLPPLPDHTPTGREFMAILGLKPRPPEATARAALRGVERNRAVIPGDAMTRAIWYLQRASPAAVDLVGRVTARRVLAAMGRPGPLRRR